VFGHPAGISSQSHRCLARPGRSAFDAGSGPWNRFSRDFLKAVS